MIRRSMLALLWLWCAPAGAWTTPYFTETFENVDPAWWGDRDAGKMIVSVVSGAGNPGHALQCYFGALAFGRPSANIADAVVIQGDQPGGYFTGNYLESGVQILGLDFKCADTLPVSFDVFLTGENGRTIHRSLHGMLGEPGSWQSLKVVVDSAEAGAWLGHTEDFDAIMTAVTSVVFQLSRNGEQEQSYVMDNVYLDALPEIAVESTSAEDASGVRWNNLRVGQRYYIEACVDLRLDGWVIIDTFVASSTVYASMLPYDSEFRYFRLVMP